MPGRKIAGIILFCMAFPAFLIPTVLGGILVGLILAVPFLVCGIICFLARRRPGLWCAWVLYLMADSCLHSSTALSWVYIHYTFSWEQMELPPVYIIVAWIQVLLTLALLIATVRSFRKSPFPPNRRNGAILALVWAGFLVSRLPFIYLILPLGAYVLSIGALMALVSTVQGIASLILLAIALTLSVRMVAAWRTSNH